MLKTYRRAFLALGLLAAFGLLTQPAAGGPVKTVTEGGILFNVDNYSPAGADLGTAGFWFANFDSATAVSGEAVDSNAVNQLPSWVVPDFDPLSADYSFGDAVTSSGSPGWDLLRLPDGTTGAAGSLVDPEAENNSNNTIKDLRLGAGTPVSFLMHVVVDHTFGTHDPIAGRIRGRAESGDGVFEDDFRYEPVAADFNGTADVYSFRYDGWEEGDFIKLQLNSGIDGVQPGIAGLMFDVVPEPTSSALLLLGLLGAAGTRRRRG